MVELIQRELEMAGQFIGPEMGCKGDDTNFICRG